MPDFKKKYAKSKPAGVSPLRFVLICWVILLVVFGLDFLVKYRLSFSVFYILPILMLSRYSNIKHTVSISFIAAALLFFSDISSGHPYALVWAPYWNGFVRLIFFITIPSLLYFWSKENVNALHDSLTGLPNRRSFMQTAEYEMKRCRRYGHPMSLAFIDLDNFKQINDKFGHQAGDILLGQIAEAFQKNIRDTDSFARIGGDEFVLLMPETDDASAFSVMTRDINRVTPPLLSGIYSSVTLSVGILTCLKNPPDLSEIMKRADQLMYEAKKEGKNRIKTAVYKGLDVSGLKSERSEHLLP